VRGEFYAGDSVEILRRSTPESLECGNSSGYDDATARVAELADARDLGSRGETLEGSSPSSRTNTSLSLRSGRGYATGPWLGKAASTTDLVPRSLKLPRRAPPPLGYFAETSRAANGVPCVSPRRRNFEHFLPRPGNRPVTVRDEI
jgi:hypothetical protein